jgi:hypothetical protein
MRVAVTVPRHLRLTELWLGISTGTEGIGPGGPTGMYPILAHSREPLSAGAHTFGLRWPVPEGQTGGSLYLVAAWSSVQPPVSTAGPISMLVVH